MSRRKYGTTFEQDHQQLKKTRKRYQKRDLQQKAQEQSRPRLSKANKLIVHEIAESGNATETRTLNMMIPALLGMRNACDEFRHIAFNAFRYINWNQIHPDISKIIFGEHWAMQFFMEFEAERTKQDVDKPNV